MARKPRLKLPISANLLHLLADDRRLKLLPEIAAQFEVLHSKPSTLPMSMSFRAQQLSAEQSKTLQAALERRLGLSVAPAPAGG